MPADLSAYASSPLAQTGDGPGWVQLAMVVLFALVWLFGAIGGWIRNQQQKGRKRREKMGTQRPRPPEDEAPVRNPRGDEARRRQGWSLEDMLPDEVRAEIEAERRRRAEQAAREQGRPVPRTSRDRREPVVLQQESAARGRPSDLADARDEARRQHLRADEIRRDAVRQRERLQPSLPPRTETGQAYQRPDFTSHRKGDVHQNVPRDAHRNVPRNIHEAKRPGRPQPKRASVPPAGHPAGPVEVGTASGDTTPNVYESEIGAGDISSSPTAREAESGGGRIGLRRRLRNRDRLAEAVVASEILRKPLGLREA